MLQIRKHCAILFALLVLEACFDNQLKGVTIVNYCVEMLSDESTLGKWIDGSCERKNAFVCQKAQTWTMARLQKTLLETRKQVTNALDVANKKISDQKHEFEEANKKNKLELDETRKQVTNALDVANKKISDQKHEFDEASKKSNDQKRILEEANKKIESLEKNLNEQKQNSIPIGYIYTQLPNEKPPSSIWPTMTWTDVSSAYAGVFFRVEGGGSESFGQAQAENAPRVVGMESTFTGVENNRVHQSITVDAAAQNTMTSNWIWTGDEAVHKNYYTYVRLVTSTGEVRPRNMAIRVFKRTG